MVVYIVTLRNAAGRERVERIVATTAQNASNLGLLRIERETGAPKGEWQVVSALDEYAQDALIS